jgi:hypothetical protein
MAALAGLRCANACSSRGSVAGDDAALGGLQPDSNRPDRRLHDLVRGRLPQEKRDELFDTYRRVSSAWLRFPLMVDSTTYSRAEQRQRPRVQSDMPQQSLTAR